MATVVRRNQGKTEFVKDVLTKNAFANAKLVNDEWQKAGRDGSISETLVNKMRSDLGLTGNLRGGRPKHSETGTAEKPKYTGKKRGRKPKAALPVSTAAPSNGKPVEGARAKSGSRSTQLTSLEADIDVLLFKVMNLGGLEEIENSLRRTRRLLYAALDSDNA
jgi:hypothetical protein